MMKPFYKICIFIFLIFIVFNINSCNEKIRRNKIEKIINDLAGKTITIPELPLLFPNSDSSVNKHYKIIRYIDSTGCISCKLNTELAKWKDLFNKDESNYIDFFFYFHPKNKRELYFILESMKFNQNIYFDIDNQIKILNDLPDEQAFHCFLLNSKNEILAVGNPALNSAIWELYIKIINTHQ